MTALLEVRNLRVAFSTFAGEVMAVDDVSLSLASGETLGIVGESGSGKSVLSLSIMRLVPEPPGRYAAGEIIFQSEDLLQKSEREMCEIRGSRIAMIFQEPMTALNPVYTIGRQIAEGLRAHASIGSGAARQQAIELLRRVRIPSPETRVDSYPHQLSGGMRQRAMIAMALAGDPVLLIADEPTTALDVTVQAQILQLLRDLRQSIAASIIMITHDLGVVAEMADQVVVMYAGRIVEAAPVRALFENTMHPYTIGLMSSIPQLGGTGGQLSAIPGMVPSLAKMPTGCRFHPRCPLATSQCEAADPPLRTIGERHRVACWLAPIENPSGNGRVG